MKAIVNIKVLEIAGVEINDDLKEISALKVSTKIMLKKLSKELEKYFKDQRITTKISYEVQDG